MKQLCRKGRHLPLCFCLQDSTMYFTQTSFSLELLILYFFMQRLSPVSSLYADTLKNSLWLAIEDAVNYGVKMPDLMFIFNTADHPLCFVNKLMACNDTSFAPPISIMGLDAAKMGGNNLFRARADLPSVIGDILTPLFRVWTSLLHFLSLIGGQQRE